MVVCSSTKGVVLVDALEVEDGLKISGYMDTTSCPAGYASNAV